VADERGLQIRLLGNLAASYDGVPLDLGGPQQRAGGDLLVHTITVGPEGESERLYGNFPSYSLYPDR
jgi:hypothetical protein